VVKIYEGQKEYSGDIVWALNLQRNNVLQLIQFHWNATSHVVERQITGGRYDYVQSGMGADKLYPRVKRTVCKKLT
jgi:hypothetical protein